MLKIVPSPQSENAWSDLERSFASLTKPSRSDLQGVRTMILGGFAESFVEEASAGSPWDQLAPMTADERIFEGYDPYHPILVRTGAYRRSFTDAGAFTHISEMDTGADGFTIYEGSADERVDDLEYGTDRIPPRPVMILSREAERAVGDELDAMIERMLGGTT